MMTERALYIRIRQSFLINDLGNSSGPLASINNETTGSHVLNIDITNWYTGVNYLIIQIRDEIYSSAIFKQ